MYVPRDQRTYSQIHSAHFAKRAHDRSTNRHWRAHGNCVHGMDHEQLRYVRAHPPNYSSVSAVRLYKQLIFEELELIKMFSNLMR
jgi:hypothetical protein